MTVTELIDELDLKSKCRKRELVYTRYVIFKYLHENKYSLTAIAKMFNIKQHGTIISGLNNISKYEKYPKQYAQFHEIKNEIMIRLGLNTNFRKQLPLSNLETRILSCKSYIKLVALQNEVKKNIEERENEVEIFTTFDI